MVRIEHGHAGDEVFVRLDQIARIDKTAVTLVTGERFVLVTTQQYERIVRQVERMQAR